MRVRLIKTLRFFSLEGVKHGFEKGREFDVLERDGKPLYQSGKDGYAFVLTDAGVERPLLCHEFEIMEGDECESE